jgi:hypothetical protein
MKRVIKKPNIQKESKEVRFLSTLKTPAKIQDYLDSIPFNFGEDKESAPSPVCTVRTKKADCLDGALLAAACLWLQGEVPYIMNLKVRKGFKDDDHAVAVYTRNGYFGAVSKTNHAVLRFRDPVYKTIRELAMSYFHEYYLYSDGTKTMCGYSPLIDLRRFGDAWITQEEDVWGIAETIYHAKHVATVPPVNKKYIRKATAFERRVLGTQEYKK